MNDFSTNNFAFGNTPSNYNSLASSWQFNGAAILWLIVFVIFLVVAFILFERMRHRLHRLSYTRQQIFLVRLPKDQSEQEQKSQASSPTERLRNDIAKSEAIVAAIGGLRAQKGMRHWLLGRNDHFALELVAVDGLICFYVAAPEAMGNLLEQTMHAYYPEADITAVPDYNIFQPTGQIAAGSLRTNAHYIFPLKTYEQDDTDQMANLINLLGRLDHNSGAAIQFVVRSAPRKWHKKIAKLVAKIHKLGSIRQAIKGDAWAKALAIPADIIGTMGAKDKDKLQPQKQLSQLEADAVKAMEQKNAKAGLEVNIRLVASAPSRPAAEALLNNLAASFAQYNHYQYGNSFGSLRQKQEHLVISDFIARHFDEAQSCLLNSEELASLYHLPLPTTATPNVLWLSAKEAAAPVNLPANGLILGENIYRGIKKEVRIKASDRSRHMYMVGKSGVGKSILLANLAIQDIINGEGLCLLDPHGDLVADILERIPPERAEDVILFNPSDSERPLGLNLLEFDARYPEQKTFVINEMIGIFDKLYDLKATGGPIFEQYMRNAMLLVMSDPASGSTLMEIPKVLADATFRNYKLSKCQDYTVVDFWRGEAEKAGGDAALANVVPYITSKLTSFISNDLMRPIIGQQKSSFNLRDVMDQRKILLISLPKGVVGELNAYLLGMILVGKILMSALSRADLPSSQRHDFYLYIDEFQNFTTDSICQVLSEARKYGLSLIMAHQYIGQLTVKNNTAIKDAVFGNVGTLVSFKIGPEDAEFLVKEFNPPCNQFDLINLERGMAYIKLLIDNSSARPFSLKTPWPLYGMARPEISDQLKTLSRLKYGRDKQIVEAEIAERYFATKKEVESR